MKTNKAAELFRAALQGDAAQIRRLLPPVGDPAEDGLPDPPAGVTPLMAAAVAGHEAVVMLLLECGADPARRDEMGRTAAAYARAGGHHDLADHLDTVVDKEMTLR